MIDIRTPALQRFHRDWEARRKGRLMPARADFDVLDLKYLIGSIAIIDVAHDPLRFRYRLHGTAIARRVGYDLTGKTVEDIPLPPIRDLVRAHYTAVVETGAPRVEFRERRILDDRMCDSEVLVLPLSRDGSAVDMLMVGVAFL